MATHFSRNFPNDNSQDPSQDLPQGKHQNPLHELIKGLKSWAEDKALDANVCGVTILFVMTNLLQEPTNETKLMAVIRSDVFVEKKKEVVDHQDGHMVCPGYEGEGN
eukprot:7371534-Ditylum_brightwellii.AAC.1